MLAWGVTAQDVADIVNVVSEERYKGNVDLDGGMAGHVGKTNRSAVTFRLRVTSSQEPGHRIRITSRGKGFARMPSACWHVHRDVLAELFKRFPEARVKSALADYKGQRDFENKFPETFYGAGSGLGGAEGHVAYANFSGGACECHVTEEELTKAIMTSGQSGYEVRQELREIGVN